MAATGTGAGAAESAIERRYLGLVHLSQGASGASSWGGVASALGQALKMLGTPASVRVWGTTPDGFGELSRHPRDAAFGPLPQRDLRRAAERLAPAPQQDGRLLVGLQASGVSMGVLEIADAEDQGEVGDFLAQAAPIVASTVGLLAAQGVGDAVLEPLSVEAASDGASVMSSFAAQARRLLEHDRLSAYLLTPDGHSFERFAVATSPIVPGEGVVIPFEDVGLRHIVITNRALVSEDISADPRIVGREDRLIARAGFRGLLSAPLRREGRPIGVLNFVSRTPGFYREEDIPIAQQMADQVSAFLENLRRQRRMQALVIQEATERERARLSRDLYDVVAQTVPAINSIATDLRDRIERFDEGAARDAARIVELSDPELADMRRAIIGMSPRELDSHTLEEVVESSLANFNEATGVEVTWAVDGETSNLPGAVQRAAYRVLQELLTNIRLHSRAASLRATLVVDDGLSLVIEDDGIGFEPDDETFIPGLGIQGMTERATALGGSFSIESGAGDGTRACFEIPAVGDAGAELAGGQPDLDPAAEGESGATLRVFVAEPDTLVRSGLIRILERAGAIRIVGEAGTANEVSGQVPRFCPDVVLLAEQLDAECPSELIKELTASSPGSSIVILSRNTAGRGEELLASGVGGVVHTAIGAEELVDAVRAVANGTRLVTGPAGSDDDDPGTSPLSKRERGVLELIAAGQTNAEIAETLFFATKTVERHVATIVSKLGARNRAHAAALAASRRIISIDDG